VQYKKILAIIFKEICSGGGDASPASPSCVRACADYL